MHWEAIEWSVVDGVQELQVWVDAALACCVFRSPVLGGSDGGYVAMVQSRAGECKGAMFRRSALARTRLATVRPVTSWWEHVNWPGMAAPSPRWSCVPRSPRGYGHAAYQTTRSQQCSASHASVAWTGS